MNGSLKPWTAWEVCHAKVLWRIIFVAEYSVELTTVPPLVHLQDYEVSKVRQNRSPSNRCTSYLRTGEDDPKSDERRQGSYFYRSVRVS